MRATKPLMIAAALLFSSSAQAAVLEQITPTATAYVDGVDFSGFSAFGPVIFDITGTLTALSVPDGLGGQQLGLGCNASDYSGFASGSIALVSRGGCLFQEKTALAQAAGAIGVLVADNFAGPISGSGGAAPTITIPTFRTNFALRSDFYTLALTGNSTFHMASAVPEPATWAMMVVGFGMLGGALRRHGAITALSEKVHRRVQAHPDRRQCVVRACR